MKTSWFIKRCIRKVVVKKEKVMEAKQDKKDVKRQLSVLKGDVVEEAERQIVETEVKILYK